MTAAQMAAVLRLHPGPYFNGIDQRCGCKQPVSGAQGWARHVAALLDDTARPIDLADPKHPAVQQALQMKCGLCQAGPGQHCVSLTDTYQLQDIVHRYRVDSTHR